MVIQRWENPSPSTPRTSKSSLLSHTFPPFYSCYLLKSIQHPKSRATYIGSTPDPPRRIRQHNGLLKAGGAWKTSRNRPWVMSMIVYGFPSKLAALQFEWAWQHPTRSRHLRGVDMTAARSLKGNIEVVYSMLTTHPYNSWPLHVKLFTSQGVAAWNSVARTGPPLPVGLTVQIELEGVDGKSGDFGSGRNGPISVSDKMFTSRHLEKHMGFISKGQDPLCGVCGSPIHLSTLDPLTTALCPTSDCLSYSHLQCLATSFLQDSIVDETTLIPRGGTCSSCNKYTLWGDIVRGCYRRRTGVAGAIVEQEAIMETEEVEEHEELLETVEPYHTKSSSRKRHARKSAVKTRKELLSAAIGEEEDEFFDLDNISGSDTESSARPSVSASRPRKSVPVINEQNYGFQEESEPDVHSYLMSDDRGSSTPPKRKRSSYKGNVALPIDDDDEGECFDLDNITSSDSSMSGIQKRKQKRIANYPVSIVNTDADSAAGASSGGVRVAFIESKNEAAIAGIPRRRGRPPGSKNKPKSNTPPAQQTSDGFDVSDVSQFSSDKTPNATNGPAHPIHIGETSPQEEMIDLDDISSTGSSVSQESVGIPGPRRRGRPKGSTGKASRAHVVSQSNHKVDVHAQAADTHPTSPQSPTFDIADILERTTLNDKPKGSGVRKKASKAKSVGKRGYSTFQPIRPEVMDESRSIIELSD